MSSRKPKSSFLAVYFRCPESFDRTMWRTVPSLAKGFFRFGEDVTCFGAYHGQQASSDHPEVLCDALAEAVIANGTIDLPFDPLEVTENLHRELYVGEWRKGSLSVLSSIYYLFRPWLPVGIRRHLQKLHLGDWKKLQFPSWPVDCSVDNLAGQLMLQSLRASGTDRIPFIWFWPNGKSSCAIMTHDVETEEGCDHCSELMEIDEAFEIKASFQIVPEKRYRIRSKLVDEMRSRGFEICVHDLNHDGHLYKNRKQFLQRAVKINAYGRIFGATGFRAASLYRKQLWYDALQFSYDMSVPNVAHLDPQRGGCCTVMPYFVNEILEIPVTTIQDYSLYNILKDYSTSIWKQQCEIIMEKHGCMNFIVHPDYIKEPRELKVYKQLLMHLNEIRRDKNVWITTPGEVDRWWRQRQAMELIETDRGWTIKGEGSERASIGYAQEVGGRLALRVEGPVGADSTPKRPIGSTVPISEMSASG